MSWSIKQKRRFGIAATVVSSMSLAGFLLVVDPSDKAIVYIFIPIVLTWIALFSVAKLLLYLLLPHHSVLYSYLVFIVVSMIVLLLLLSGIGQLRIIDLILIISLTLIMGFYFYRSWG